MLTALLLVPLLVASPAWAQSEKKTAKDEEEAAKNLPDPAVELAGLLGEDSSEWFQTLQALRERPDESRDLMMLAVEQDIQAPNRWRIFHHIIEFGRSEDIPLLLERMETAATPLEKMALEGSARALYPAAYQGDDLSLVVEGFSFAQTKSPEPLESQHTGKLLMSRSVFENYHREGLPIVVIKKLLPLRGRAYRNESILEQAMRRALRKKEWETHRVVLLAPVEPVQEFVAQEGLLRFQMRNPLARPLMLKVTFNAWGARFDPAIESRLVYLAPDASKQVDLPVRVIKSRETTSARLGMRMWEVNGQFVPIFQKLYITF